MTFCFARATSGADLRFGATGPGESVGLRAAQHGFRAARDGFFMFLGFFYKELIRTWYESSNNDMLRASDENHTRTHVFKAPFRARYHEDI